MNHHIRSSPIGAENPHSVIASVGELDSPVDVVKRNSLLFFVESGLKIQIVEQAVIDSLDLLIADANAIIAHIYLQSIIRIQNSQIDHSARSVIHNSMQHCVFNDRL